MIKATVSCRNNRHEECKGVVYYFGVDGDFECECQCHKEVRSGRVKCATHKVDVVIGKNGFMFCPIENCVNSEENYK